MRGKRTFVVGRKTRKDTTIVLARASESQAVRGPWQVKAVVTPASPKLGAA